MVSARRGYLAAILVLVAVLLFSVGLACTISRKADMPIALLSDFGTEDWRLPRLKGTIYTAFPDARVVDVSHIETGIEIQR